MTLTLSMKASDGSSVYLRDDPDGVIPRRTDDPFLARPFPDRAAVDAYIAEHPEVDRPDVRVVPWPIDLDRAVCVEPHDDFGPMPMPKASVARSFRPEVYQSLFESLDGRDGAADYNDPMETRP